MAYNAPVGVEEQGTPILLTPSVSQAQEVGRQLNARAREIENNRRLPLDLVEELAGLGVFRMWLPRSLGGGEVDLQQGLGIIEELSYWDASSGWCTMIGASTSVLAGFLPEEHASEIFGDDPGTVTGGVFAPAGLAQRRPGGLAVSGRWSWGSGTQHCRWIGAGTRLAEDGDEQRRNLFVFLESSSVRFLDTWDAMGLRGTGSTDFEVEEAFVPEGRWVELGVDRPRVEGALYRFPAFGLLALSIASVIQGLARRALDELKEIAVSKRYYGSRRLLAERSSVQEMVARSEAGFRASQAFLESAVDEAWRGATKGDISVAQRARLRLAATFAAEQGQKVVDCMYRLAGGSAVYATSPMQRLFRDVHVATQHAMVAARSYELLGRLSLGLETDTSQL